MWRQGALNHYSKSFQGPCCSQDKAQSPQRSMWSPEGSGPAHLVSLPFKRRVRPCSPQTLHSLTSRPLLAWLVIFLISPNPTLVPPPGSSWSTSLPKSQVRSGPLLLALPVCALYWSHHSTQGNLFLIHHCILSTQQEAQHVFNA